MLHVFDTTDEVLTALADYFVRAANDAMLEKRSFTVVLSGGSSPKKLYELLASAQYKQKVDWTKIYFFFGDERDVPDTDKDSNALMATKALFEPLKIRSSQIHKVNTSLPPADAAQAYTDTINRFFGFRATFDLILLGLGDNSHTASLFPHTPILHDDTPSVKSVWVGENVNAYRISFTAPLINHAHKIAFLVYGEGKAEAVHHVLKDATDIDQYPAQLIRKNVDWFLDKAAATKL
ncbi:6-phosphogluconolactonase [Mucilaginibacter sp. AW1-3]